MFSPFLSLQTILASVLVPIFLMSYIYKRDTFQKEPWRLLLKAFGFGVLSALLTLVVDTGLAFILPSSPESPFGKAFYEAFFGAAIPEEFCKLLMLYLCIWKSPYFDEYYDGLEYAAFVGLGFAALENVLYTISYGWGVLILRHVFSLPGHVFFAIFMGYFFSLARFHYDERKKYLALAFVVPVILHGLFDIVLMYKDNLSNNEGSDGVIAILFLAFLVFFFFLWRFAVRRVKEMSGK